MEQFMKFLFIFSFLFLTSVSDKCLAQDLSSKSTKDTVTEHIEETLEGTKKINPKTTDEELSEHIEGIIERTEKIRKKNREDVEEARKMLEDAKKEQELINLRTSIIKKTLNGQNLTKQEAEYQVLQFSDSYADYNDLQKRIEIKRLMGLPLSDLEENELDKVVEIRKRKFAEEQKKILEHYQKLGEEKRKQDELRSKKPVKPTKTVCHAFRDGQYQEVDCGELSN